MEKEELDLRASATPREAARMLEIRLDGVYSLIWAGRLPAEKRDGRWIISRDAVEARVKSKDIKRREIC